MYKSDLAETKLEEMLDYMRNIVMVEERFLEIRDFCRTNMTIVLNGPVLGSVRQILPL
jgi:hypothetical protein